MLVDTQRAKTFSVEITLKTIGHAIENRDCASGFRGGGYALFGAYLVELQRRSARGPQAPLRRVMQHLSVQEAIVFRDGPDRTCGPSGGDHAGLWLWRNRNGRI